MNPVATSLLDPYEVLEALGVNISHENGNWIMCNCPFTSNHSNGDTSPSFGFNRETYGYNCFVCGGGTLIGLIKQLNDFNDLEAQAWLELYRAYTPKKAEDLVQKVEKLMHPVIDHTMMPSFSEESYYAYANPTKLDDIRRKHFFEERGISNEIINRFKLGFDPLHWGLTIPHYYDEGLRGWQTRHLASEDGKFYCTTCQDKMGTVPKYVNTPNFPKKETLFLYDEVIGWDVTVVESPMSALYLWSKGISNVVATFGSFSLAQAELLKKFGKVKIWPDNDAAGKKNINTVVGELSKATNVVIVPVVDIPHGDAADVKPDALYEYLFSAYSPSILPLFKGELPTLDQVKTTL